MTSNWKSAGGYFTSIYILGRIIIVFVHNFSETLPRLKGIYANELDNIKRLNSV